MQRVVAARSTRTASDRHWLLRQLPVEAQLIVSRGNQVKANCFSRRRGHLTNGFELTRAGLTPNSTDDNRAAILRCSEGLSDASRGLRKMTLLCRRAAMSLSPAPLLTARHPTSPL